MHWIMWIFWGSIATLVVGIHLLSFLTGRKYNFEEQEKSLNQNLAGNDTLQAGGPMDHFEGPL